MFPPTIGISVDDLWIRYACNVKESAQTNRVEFGQFGNHGSFPNAILLPRIDGEPFRFDVGDVPHARGSGLTWPSEAIVDTDHGSGRLPIGRLLNRIEASNSFVWAIEEKRSFSCTDALAGAIAQACPNYQGEIVFVVPNHWNVELQQALLDSFQKENLRCKLLWRPIAAALEWTEFYAKQLESLLCDTKDHSEMLLSVFLGYGEIEITELKLVDWNANNGLRCIVPGRRRPSPTERFPGFGFRQVLNELSKNQASVSNPLLDQEDLMSYAWNQLWCRPNLGAFLSGFQYRLNGFSRVPDEVEQSVFGCKQLDFSELHVRLSASRAKLSRNYAGIVFSGPLAAAKLNDQRQVHEFVLESLDTQSDCVLIEDDKIGRGLLARGAHRFAARLASDLPTFLDTLPRLEMVILEKGEPTWIDLLEPDQKWVEGGKEWQRPERVQGLRLSPKSVDLKVAIAHEDFEHVREVVTNVPPTSDQTERVSLSVKMTPAQGNARIEIHPENESLFKNKRVFIDWKHMREFQDDHGNTKDKEGYLNSLPRIFPELLPRLSSGSKMRVARVSMEQLKQMFINQNRKESIELQLRQVRQHLQAKDQRMYPRDATAFDCEGNCVGNSYDLKSFMDSAWPYFQKEGPQGFIRAIAYTHVEYPLLEQFILQGLTNEYSLDEIVLAAGKCLRKPEHIAEFVKSFLRQLGRGGSSQTWWRALSEILRFRGNALQYVSSEECAMLLNRAGRVFASERARGEGGETFRLACLVVVYTLRRRAFDDSFLEPKSTLAESLKSEFKQARVDAKEGRIRLIQGSVNLSEQLQLIIDYVDRKGKGQLLIGD